MPHRLGKMSEDERLRSYRDKTRKRLQELMLRDSYPPGHPLVSATALHLEMSTAAEATARYTAPSLDHFYRGADLFYSPEVVVPSAGRLSPPSSPQLLQQPPPLLVSKSVSV